MDGLVTGGVKGLQRDISQNWVAFNFFLMRDCGWGVRWFFSLARPESSLKAGARSFLQAYEIIWKLLMWYTCPGRKVRKTSTSHVLCAQRKNRQTSIKRCLLQRKNTHSIHICTDIILVQSLLCTKLQSPHHTYHHEPTLSLCHVLLLISAAKAEWAESGWSVAF